MFTHLHWHSYYSLLESIWAPNNIIKQIKNLGMNAAPLTDYNAVYGIFEFYNLCQKNEIKPIIGIEVIFVQNIQNQKHPDNTYILLLAKNYIWYQNLVKISTAASTIWLFDKPRVDLGMLAEYSEWLICILTTRDKGRLYKMYKDYAQDKEIIDQIELIQDIIPEIYIELIVQDYEKEKWLSDCNARSINLAQKIQKKLIISSNFHYILADDKIAFEVALCIKDGLQITSPERRKVNWDFHIFSEKEIVDTMIKNSFESEYIYDIIKNNQQIADSIDIKFPESKWIYHFPNYQTSTDIDILYDEFGKL